MMNLVKSIRYLNKDKEAVVIRRIYKGLTTGGGSVKIVVDVSKYGDIENVSISRLLLDFAPPAEKTDDIIECYGKIVKTFKGKILQHSIQSYIIPTIEMMIVNIMKDLHHLNLNKDISIVEH